MKLYRKFITRASLLSVLAVFCVAPEAAPQVSRPRFAVKTNILYDATATINLGVEAGLAKKWTLDLSANYNPWTLCGDRKFKHLLIQPEGRFWFCERFTGHFIGIHAHWAMFNFCNIDMPFGLIPGLRNNRYQGDLYGGGITYGYQWYLGRHWNLEAAVGIGYARAIYDVYPCNVDCGEIIYSNRKNYFGPTKIAVSMVYLF